MPDQHFPKLFFQIGIAVLLSSGGFSGAANGAAHKGDGLKDIHLTEFNELAGQFKQTKHLKELDVQIQTQGRFRVSKVAGGKAVFRWDIEKPKPSKFCIDPQGIISQSMTSEGLKTKNLKFSEVGPETGHQIMGVLKVMTLDPQKMGDDFEMKTDGDVLNLTPRNKSQSFFESAQLKIKSGFVQNLVIKEKSGDEIQIQFSDLKSKSTKVVETQCPR